MERVKNLAEMVVQLRQLVNNTTASSPTDLPPTDPDNWSLPPPMPKKHIIRNKASAVLTSVDRKTTLRSQVTPKILNKSTSQVHIGRNALNRRASSVGRAVKEAPQPDETNRSDDKDKNVFFYFGLLIFFANFL